MDVLKFLVGLTKEEKESLLMAEIICNICAWIIAFICTTSWLAA